MKTPPIILSKTEFAAKYIEILQPLEACVAHHYRMNPEIYDLDISRVYETLLKHIRARLTNFPLPQPNLEGIFKEIYTQQFDFIKQMETTYSLKEIQECLKMLEKSLKLWTREHGSRGYLNFISRFN